MEGTPLRTIKNFQKISQCRKILNGGNEKEMNVSLQYLECFSAGRSQVVSVKSSFYYLTNKNLPRNPRWSKHFECCFGKKTVPGLRFDIGYNVEKFYEKSKQWLVDVYS